MVHISCSNLYKQNNYETIQENGVLWNLDTTPSHSNFIWQEILFPRLWRSNTINFLWNTHNRRPEFAGKGEAWWLFVSSDYNLDSTFEIAALYTAWC